MQREIKYTLTGEEYAELKNKLGLLEESVRKERDRLVEIKNKSDSEVISTNIAEYNMSLIYDISRLVL